MHHVELDFAATDGLRLHAVETLVSMGIGWR